MMNDPENPFARKENGSPAVSKGFVVAWSMAVLMTCTALFFLMAWLQTRTNEQQKLKDLQNRLNETTSRLGEMSNQNQTNQDFITTLQQQVAGLEAEKEQTAQMSKGLEDEMRQALESKDVTISNLQGKLTVNILDRVMFDSGEAVLKPDGQAVMQKIASILAEHSGIQIMIVGHTDNVPIRSTAKSKFASNWELSTARALAAVHFLTEQAGVDPHRVGAAGYGEYRPIADNSTPEGRSRNRRITITILPNDLSGAENTATNSSAAQPEQIPAPPDDKSDGAVGK